MRRTNLNTSLIQYAPCVAPNAEFDAQSDLVMLDHEEDNGLLEQGNADALSRAHDIITETRRRMLRQAKLMFYGWPFPRDREQAKAFAPRFAGLLKRADYLAPCCYAAAHNENPDEIVRRGLHFAECVARMPREIAGKRRFAIVSDFPLDSVRACTDEQVAAQCLAARVAGCESIYVWSGLPHRVWQATRSSADHRVQVIIRDARLMLDSHWSFGMRERHGEPETWKVEDINRRYASVAAAIARTFINAWREAQAGAG